eukprot:932393_1
MHNECNFWYWYYSTYIIAGIATISILATALLALYTFCGKCSTNTKTDTMLTNTLLNESKEVINPTECVLQCRFVMKSYEMAFFCCLTLLTASLILSLASHKYCHNNILQQAFIGDMLLITGALSYHIVILTLHLLWVTSTYKQNDNATYSALCRRVGLLVSICVGVHWILMSFVAYLLNSLVNADDDILSRMNADDTITPHDVRNMMHEELKQTNDDIFLLSLIMVFIAIVSHFVIWIVISNVFGLRHGSMPSLDEQECKIDVSTIDIETVPQTIFSHVSVTV